MSRWPNLILGIGISVAAAAALVFTTDLKAVVDRLGQAQVLWLAPGLLVLALQAWVRAARWASIIRGSVASSVRAGNVVEAMLIGYFVNAVLPGRLGEVARALVASRREAVPLSGIAASVVVERALDLMTLAGLASIALALTAGDWALPFAGLAAGIAFVVGLGRQAPRLDRFLPSRTPSRFADGVRGFLRSVAAIRPRVLAGAVMLSAVAWLGDTLLVLLVSRALGLEVAFAQALAIGLGGALGTALPAAPGYLATYELGAVALGGFAGVPRETALPVAILTHVVGVSALAIAGAVALGRLGGLVRLDGLLRASRLTVAPEKR